MKKQVFSEPQRIPVATRIVPPNTMTLKANGRRLVLRGGPLIDKIFSCIDIFT
jgi:hypothetical protein